ncbi:L-rhamnose isomerase [Qiania dongpingensis]|uniref:L-rhamnose isomerase n=1 Tax=Qiania dongpingensis TaxID=2763669 RepID=A0A7G9G6Q5_9FIRM|nr:L-rhamnose isomerase [Qiania dongpingensis]QNM06487.1 L-rhamnose isomerase [Qiania dongpingensis]
MSQTEKNYQAARELYASIGVDTDKALETLKKTPISVHCWQIDDLQGFENPDAVLTGGIAATGNAPGKPESREEYMANLNQALDLIPGATKLALHAIYLDKHGKDIDRDEIGPEEFSEWVDFAKSRNIGLDFNPTYFSHPMSDSGYTLTSRDESVREFWINHGKCCRRIGEYFGKELGQVCITNHWIGDGNKDYTIDKLTPRLILKDSLDQIFAEPIDPRYNIDSVESKVFGLGSESYVPGSHEFYTNYALTKKNCIVCMDAGHFHPTESIAAKFSSYLAFGQELMLHVSRPVRWDSDHVVMLDDETKAIMEEIVRYDALDRIHIGTDYFDASINRIAATAIGARNARKALLLALLQPTEELIQIEREGNLTKRLAYYEELKAMPFGLVWEMFCEMENVPGRTWISELK